jgi:hypothetical protein
MLRRALNPLAAGCTVAALRSVGLNEHPIAKPRIDPNKLTFWRTAAFRKFGSTVEPAPDSPEDLYTKEVIREQGFDGPPHLVSRTELDLWVAAGEIELYRGVSRRFYAEQFRFGEMFVGRGIFGGGIYAASGADAYAVAQTFAGPEGAVMRMTLKAGARLSDLMLLDRDRESRMTRALRALESQERRALRQAFQRHGRSGMLQVEAG